MNAFRAETRAWLEAHCPAGVRSVAQREGDPIAGFGQVPWGSSKIELTPAA